MASREAHRTSPSARIGGAFLRAALGPVNFAASQIMGNKILAGLEELAPDSLIGGYARGVDEVVALTGVGRGDVERILPLDRLGALDARLRQSQPRAVEAWRAHAGQLGFLDVITALTVDGRQFDIGLCLSRIAGKMRHDKHLAEPVAALGVDVAELAALIDESRARLEDGTWLASALRRRQARRAAVAVLGMLTLASITTSIVIVRLKRDRVEARIEAMPACEAEQFPAGEASWARQELRAKLEDKRATCKRERAEAEERQRAEEAKLAEEKRQRERVEKRKSECKALADEVSTGRTKGELSDASKAVAKDAAPLLGRVAKKALEPADVGPTDPVFPCADTADDKRLEAAWAAALLVDPLLWARRGDPSPLARKVLLEHKAELPEKALIGLADQAERVAKQGLARGEPPTLARAKRLCALAKDLGVSAHKSCAALEKL